MLSFYKAAAVAVAPASPSLKPELRQLIADRVHDWSNSGLLDLTHLLIVEAGDTDAAIEEEVAFSPLVNRLTGERCGSPDFEPYWDWLEEHDGWFELIFTVGNDGFAFVLFVENDPAISSDLVSLCRSYATGERR